jgi:prepilin-type N-terminal cleavage/methylation domain-containing protein
MTKQRMADSPKTLRLLFRTLSRSKKESGFTLIESLVAIVVIAITLVAITPPIFWATGTRVQNRRSEQALSLAQGEIDRVRAEMERGGGAVGNLPSPVGEAQFAAYEGPVPKTGAWSKMRSTDPDKNTAETINDGIRFPAANQYIPVDTNADGKADFLVQVFRTTGVCDGKVCTATDIPQNFLMKVRVYAAMAEDSTLPKLQTDRSSLIGTTGTGQAKNRPLAVLSSRVTKSGNSKALDNYR